MTKDIVSYTEELVNGTAELPPDVVADATADFTPSTLGSFEYKEEEDPELHPEIKSSDEKIG